MSSSLSLKITLASLSLISTRVLDEGIFPLIFFMSASGLFAIRTSKKIGNKEITGMLSMKLVFFDSSENVVFNGNQVGRVSGTDISESCLVGNKLIALDFGNSHNGLFTKCC